MAHSWSRRLSVRQPLRFLRGNYARLALSVVALALGVGLVCAMDLVNRAVLRAFVEVVDTMAGRAALQITAGPDGLFSEDVAKQVAQIAGVELAVPVVTANAFTTDGASELLTVRGVDTANDAAVRVYESRDAKGLQIEDPLVFLNRPDSIVITRAFADAKHLELDDPLTLDTAAGRRTFTIRGLLEPHGIARVYAGRLVVMDLDAAEAAFTRRGFVNSVDVVVDPNASVDSVAQAIRGVLPSGLEVSAPEQRKADLHRVMQSFQTFLQGVALVGLIAAFLITFNRLATVFDGRSWQLGVLRAVGMSAGELWVDLIKESLLIGAAGVVLGIPLGCALGYLLLPAIASTTALNAKLINPGVGFGVEPTSIALAALLGFAAALLAALLPAYRAASDALAEVVRRRGFDRPDTDTRAIWTVRLLVAAGAIAALILQFTSRTPAWGLGATALLTVAVALAARPLLGLLRAPLGVFLIGMLPVTGRFAAGAIAANARRAALTVAMLAVGIGLVIWLWTVADSFEQSVVSALGTAFRADLILSSARLVSGFDDEPISGSVAGEIRGVPDVDEAIGERIRDWVYQGQTIAIDAFDPSYFNTGAFGRWQLLGQSIPDVWDAVARGDAVIVSSSFCHTFGARVGDSITLSTPTGPLTVRVGGITSAFASPNGTIEMSRATFERAWNDSLITRIHLRIAAGTESAVRERIRAAFDSRYHFRILSAGELLTYWTDQVRAAFAGLHVIGILVLFVVLIGMADTLTAGVTDRVREVGLVRAVGMDRSQVAAIVITEALVLGVLGLLLAFLLGIVQGWFWVTGMLPLLLGWTLTIAFPYRLVLLVGVLTLVACCVAALLPARYAARLDPAAALHFE